MKYFAKILVLVFESQTIVSLLFIIFATCSGDVSSVGSERMLHTHEVAGSNPARPTSKSATYENFMSGFFHS
jgi:hypothetical protein